MQEALNLGVKNQEEASGGSGSTSFFDVARAQVNLCWQAFAGRETKEFIYAPSEDSSTQDQARVDALAYLKEIGREEHEGKVNLPSQGFVTTIFGAEILTHPDGSASDWTDFIKEYCRNKNASTVGLNPEELNGVDMPYDAILEALKTCGDDMPFGKAKWCLIGQVVNEWEKAKGDKGKKDKSGKYPVRFRIISKVYKNKTEAIKDAENYKRDTSVVATLQLSAKAIKNGVEIDHIKGQSAEITQWRKEGKTEEYIADELSIEVSDLALSGLALTDKVEVPF